MSWMAWTWQTALFFSAIGFALMLMTIAELVRPTSFVRGFLPMPTTRGDRFFICLLSAAFIHLIWLGLIGQNVPIASAVSIVWAFVVMRWG